MALYVAAQSLWDTDVRFSDLLSDWAAVIYGPAAPAMVNYHNLLEKAWQKAPNTTYFLRPAKKFAQSFVAADWVCRAKAYLEEAQKAASGIPENKKRSRVYEQILLEEKMLNNWIEFNPVKCK